MDADQSTPNQKRQSENEHCPDSPQRKSQRLDANIQSPTKISDVNDDCLEKIFGHLGLEDLFNVAVANEYLRPTAGVVYKRKLGNKTVSIIGCSPSSHSHMEFFDHSVYVCGLKTCLQYLRCLGPSISNLCIWYDGWNKKRCDHIHQYLNKYCVDSLVNIEMWNKQSVARITHFEKPFVNVRSIEILHSYLGGQISSLPQWFPNIRTLKLYCVDIGWFSTDTQPFHHLVDLRIEIGTCGCGFTTTKAAHLLQLCPQLHCLDIYVRTADGMALKTLSTIIKNNPNICKLKVMQTDSMFVTLSDVQQLVNEHPSMVELELIGFEFTIVAAFAVTHQLVSLKQFRFELTGRSDYDRIVSQFDDQWQPSFDDYRNYITLQR